MKTITRDLLPLFAVRSAAALMFVAAGAPAPGRAQLHEFGIGAGIAAAVSEINTRQGPGPQLLAYAGVHVNPTLQFRGELALVHFDGKLYSNSEAPSGVSRMDLQVASVGGTLVYTPRGTGTGFYGSIGAGMYRLSLGDDSDERVPGASVGVGTNLVWRGRTLFAQTRLEVPFSTLGSSSEFSPNVYLPLTLGLRVPCCGSPAPGT
jgi:hypothetical protein